MAPPYARAATATVRMLIVRRCAEARAPNSAPTLTTANSNVYVAVVPWRSRDVNSGKTVWKLYDSVPTTAIITSGTHSSGMLRAYRRPSRTIPRPLIATGDGRSSLGRIIQRPAMTAEYDAPSSRKHQPKPTVVIKRPAIAGPTTRDPVINALLRLTALLTSASDTISTTKDRRAGLSNATVTPPTIAMA